MTPGMESLGWPLPVGAGAVGVLAPGVGEGGFTAPDGSGGSVTSESSRTGSGA